MATQDPDLHLHNSGDVGSRISAVGNGDNEQVTSTAPHRVLSRTTARPLTLKEIHDKAFWICYILDSIEFPDRLQVIGEYAFSDCDGFKIIKIPSAQVVIKPSRRPTEYTAFMHCTRLVSLELPEGWEILDFNGFYIYEYGTTTYDMSDERPNIYYGCESLVNLVIPSEQHVERIEDDAKFMENLKLGTVISNLDDLVSKLQHRFINPTIH